MNEEENGMEEEMEGGEDAGKLTPVSELGEFGLIDMIQEIVDIKSADSLQGIGDDAAVYKPAEGTVQVVSTDAYVEGVHFDFIYTPLKHLGYKCISASASDIYAMNGTPKRALVSLGLSSKMTVEAIRELYIGMQVACDYYGIDLIGGDTTSTRMGVFISVTIIGEAKEEAVVYRHGAESGDILMVSGDLGGAYVGLHILEREKTVYLETPGMQPDLKSYEYLLKRQLRPEARKDIIELLAEQGVKPKAMIDISDGLASEAVHLCKAAGLGCKIFEEKLPYEETMKTTALHFGIDPSICILNGGEDYELLFAISQEDYAKVKNIAELTAIGHFTGAEGDYQFITTGGNTHPLMPEGWKHF